MSARCVLEETWRAVGGDVYQAETCILRGDVSDGDCADAPMAAAAPEMARVLLQCMTPKYGGYCAVCNMWMGDSEEDEGDDHLDDCAIVLALRKAGVIE